MGQRVVLRLTKYTMNPKSLREFLDTAESLGLGPRGTIYYARSANGDGCLVAELPERAAEALKRTRRPETPTKAQQAVRGQLQARQDAVKTGAPVPGHVPPVARRGRVLRTRKKTTK